MNITCPCCHGKYPLEAALDSEAAGELQLLLAQAGPLARPLIAYLGLFRSKSRALSFDRALRLGKETLALCDEPTRLHAALVETIEALRTKRDQGQSKPLGNHNYLKRVLESVADRAEIIPQTIPSGFATSNEAGAGSFNEISSPPRGKRAQAIADLAQWGHSDWLRTIIADGLAAMVALSSLDGTPAAEVICRTADVWHHALAGSCGVETLDKDRLQRAFSSLVKAVEKWPEPKAIWQHMTARPRQEKLAAPPPSDEQIATDLQALAKIRRNLGSALAVPADEKQDEEGRRRQLRQQAEELERQQKA